MLPQSDELLENRVVVLLALYIVDWEDPGSTACCLSAATVLATQACVSSISHYLPNPSQHVGPSCGKPCPAKGRAVDGEQLSCHPLEPHTCIQSWT